MSDDHILNACVYQHLSRDFAGVSALVLEVHVLCAYCYVSALYSLNNRDDVDCGYAVNNIYIVRFYNIL